MSRILIADDHPLVRDALRSAVLYSCQAQEIHEAGCLDDVVTTLAAKGELDLVLLDLNMPGMNGLTGLVALRRQFPAIPIAVVSAHEDRKVMLEAVRYGAAGFIPKSTPRDAIAGALRRILAGEVYLPESVEEDAAAEDDETAEIARRLSTLTAQQLRVLEMLGTGKLNKEIAYELNITETTVKAHVSAILQKLKVYSRTQAVVFANRLQLERARFGI
ncbi:response regulator [Azospirillum rugosum]|uniref:DNA-binding NarL/FixJ family response regulator n=1 Tax=Azospirillum rugosum TaxID=416170 RepID=A0ABS4SKI9_9PROT|nr:response regulator transcription factor [Azospirillum rugosum]MBP2293015.1 DNA-binding NarL/FixJ family response regulator [Azospirillum rugosum]MDQ0526564.1 DNA-binding NarL/FixJ family response regulator [Azospirillum rugosum]